MKVSLNAVDLGSLSSNNHSQNEIENLEILYSNNEINISSENLDLIFKFLKPNGTLLIKNFTTISDDFEDELILTGFIDIIIEPSQIKVSKPSFKKGTSKILKKKKINNNNINAVNLWTQMANANNESKTKSSSLIKIDNLVDDDLTFRRS